MTRINEIWNELENDKSLAKGLLLRRYSATTRPDVFIALQRPELVRCIALRIESNETVNVSRYSNLKDVKLFVIPDENDVSRNFLLIALLSKEYKEVFAILAEDLINQISNIIDEKKLLKEILNRFEKWKSLFDKVAQEGLTPEEQRGLYGELYFLRKWINKSKDLQHCVQSWLGIEKELRDFQFGGWAVEVKTTHGNNHQKIHISSERQLDNINLDLLILYHISLESQRKHGETLNELVNSIIELLTTDVAAQAQFRSKLLQGGYFLNHALKYEDTGYQIRREMFYNVRDDFPRICEADIRNGVGDVKYSIILSNDSGYAVPESFVFEATV